MPLYEYECFVCHRRFERLQRVNDEPAKECPSCGGSVRRLLGAPALQFKGSGWYVTDYAKGGRDQTRARDSSEASKGGAESGGSEKKEGAKAAETSSTTGSSSTGGNGAKSST